MTLILPVGGAFSSKSRGFLQSFGGIILGVHPFLYIFPSDELRCYKRTVGNNGNVETGDLLAGTERREASAKNMGMLVLIRGLFM
jgi:hypothetical protein